MNRHEFAHQLAQYAYGTATGNGEVTHSGGGRCVYPSVVFHGACEQDGTPAPANPVPIKINNSKWESSGGGAVDLSQLPEGGLRGIGSICDEWNCQSGDGVRKVYTLTADGQAIKVTSVVFHTASGLYYASIRLTEPSVNGSTVLSTHFTSIVPSAVVLGRTYITSNGSLLVFVPTDQTLDTVAKVNGWLTAQNGGGTPVTFAVVRATTAPFHITPQTMIQAGGQGRLTQVDGDIDDTEAEVTFVAHS